MVEETAKAVEKENIAEGHIPTEDVAPSTSDGVPPTVQPEELPATLQDPSTDPDN